jgi:hypothetical protein
VNRVQEFVVGGYFPGPHGFDSLIVLVRTNGLFANALWNQILVKSSHFTHRFSRSDEVAVAPHHEETFAFFPVMAGEGWLILLISLQT